MNSSAISSIEALDAAIQSQNPFNKPAIVTNQDVWGEGFSDVSTLNSHASDAVFRAIAQVSNGQLEKTSIAIAAEPGMGKSHVISRIRHRLKTEGGALFIYSPFGKYSELKLIKYQFQQILADSLRQTGSQGVTQWQELAAAIVTETFRKLKPFAKVPDSPKYFVAQFSQSVARSNSLIDKMTIEASKVKPHISDPDVVRAILWTLSENHAAHAIKWLSGKDLSEIKACELGLPNPDKEDRESQSFDIVRQILDLISDYNALTICFDEIDGTGYSDETGFSKAQVVAQLVKDLFDNLCKGVILTVMMPDTWRNQIKLLPNASGIPARVSAQGDPISLRYLDGDSIIELVTLWLKEFYEGNNLVPHHPIYPFEESKLREIGKQKPTFRQVLSWCRDNFKVPGLPPVIEREDKDVCLVELAVNKATKEEYGEVLEDVSLLDEALYFSFSTLIDQTVEGVTIENIADVEPRGDNGGYINFKVVGKENGKIVKIGVSIRQESHGKSVSAGLKRLIQYKKFDLTRGCLVRSKKINPKWSAYDSVNELLVKMAGEWVLLRVEDVMPLIAILSVYVAREDYGLSEQQIFDFISKTGITANNPLILEILSDPSGQVPSDVFDDDLPISVPSMNGIVDSGMTDLADIANKNEPICFT